MPQYTTATLTERVYSTSGSTAYLTFSVETIHPFQEGQFVMISSHEEESRKKPYSIASTNTQLTTQKTISFVIKETSPYGMSHYLNKTLALGGGVTLSSPLGHYKKPNENKYFLFVSTGSGLGPNLSLHKSLLETDKYQHIIHIYGERSSNELINETIAQLFPKPEAQGGIPQGDAKNIIDVRLCFSRVPPQELPGVRKINKENSHTLSHMSCYVQDQIQDALDELGKATAYENITVAICGQPKMVEDVMARVCNAGIQRKNVIVEKY